MSHGTSFKLVGLILFAIYLIVQSSKGAMKGQQLALG